MYAERGVIRRTPGESPGVRAARAPPSVNDGDAGDVDGAFRTEVAAHGARLVLAQEQAQLGAADLADDIDQTVALRGFDPARHEVLLVGVAESDAAAGTALDAAHDDRLEVQVLQTLALIHLECDARGLRPRIHQARGAGEGRGIGVLILKPARIGHDAGEQARGDIGRTRPSRCVEQLLDEDRRGGGRRHADRHTTRPRARLATAAESASRPRVGTSTEMNTS